MKPEGGFRKAATVSLVRNKNKKKWKKWHQQPTVGTKMRVNEEINEFYKVF